MKLTHGSTFKCNYCETELHVYTGKQVEALCFRIASTEREKQLIKEAGGEEYFTKLRDHRAAESLAEHLLENGYVKITEDLNYSLSMQSKDDIISFNYMLKVVKPED